MECKCLGTMECKCLGTMECKYLGGDVVIVCAAEINRSTKHYNSFLGLLLHCSDDEGNGHGEDSSATNCFANESFKVSVNHPFSGGYSESTASFQKKICHQLLAKRELLLDNMESFEKILDACHLDNCDKNGDGDEDDDDIDTARSSEDEDEEVQNIWLPQLLDESNIH